MKERYLTSNCGSNISPPISSAILVMGRKKGSDGLVGCLGRKVSSQYPENIKEDEDGVTWRICHRRVVTAVDRLSFERLSEMGIKHDFGEVLSVIRIETYLNRFSASIRRVTSVAFTLFGYDSS